MAHGNFSDLVFLALLAIALQFFFFPMSDGPARDRVIYVFDGPSEWPYAWWGGPQSDMARMVPFAGSLLLMIGLMFSGVKWNPKNGKMAGIGGMIAAIVTAVSVFQGDSYTFVPHLFYVYALVLLAGAVHIFKFPSNPLPPPAPETKNNHGNFSDLIALGLLCCGLLCIIDPDHLLGQWGLFSSEFYSPLGYSPVRLLIKFIGGLMLMIALIFSGVKWNPINGKLAGIGGFVAAGVAAHSGYLLSGRMLRGEDREPDPFDYNEGDAPDVHAGPFSVFFIYSALLFAGALHIFMFPANPKPEPAVAEGGAPLLA